MFRVAMIASALCVLVLAACNSTTERSLESVRPRDAAVLAGSAHDAGVDAAACIPRAEADARANDKAFLATIDVAHSAKLEPPVLIEDLCWKFVYRYGRYRIAVYRGVRGGLEYMGVPPMVRTSGCLDKAIELATTLVPYAKTIIEHGRKLYGVRWADRDVGVLKWINCAPPYEIGTLLHEVNHLLREGDCLHDPEGAPLCFEGMQKLPPRRLARLDRLPLSPAEGHGGYEAIHRTYFVAMGGESIVTLHDELLAYAITMDAATALIATDTKPEAVMGLPLQAYMTVRYWELVRRKQPSDFERVLGPSTANRAALQRLFARAERSYDAWRAVRSTLTGEGNQMYARGEAKLWKLYLDSKRRLFAQ